MSYTIEPHFETDFYSTWITMLQREVSSLGSLVKREQVNGERKRYSFREQGSMREISGRLAKTSVDTVTTNIRYLYTRKFEEAIRHDEWDDIELGDLGLPTSEDMQNMIFAYNRQVDEVILDALGGVAYTGEAGTTETALPSAQLVDENVGGNNTGMLFAKVREANRILNANHVPRSGRVFVIGTEEEDDMLNSITELKSKDYFASQVIDKGSVDGLPWMGFQWVVSTAIDDRKSGNLTPNYAFHKDHIILGDGARRFNMDVLPDDSHALQLRTRARIGAMRKQEEAVVEVTTYHA